MEGRERFLALLVEALEAVRATHFFQTERGYQGELLAELRNRLPTAGFTGDPIVEQEYQKRLRDHRIRIRPDLIIHIPFVQGVTEGRGEGNFVVIELKRNKNDVAGAFENLLEMKELLDYPLTIFIMIDSAETYATMCPKSIAAQTVCFAVRLEDGRPIIKSEACG